MKKLLVLLFLSINAFSSDSVVFKEGADVPGWLDNPAALIGLILPPAPCKEDEIEYKGILYTDFSFHFYYYMLANKYGSVPPGLYLKTLIKDSTVYFVDAGVCFEKSKDYNSPAGDTLTHFPLKIFFPEAASDTVKATALTNYMELFFNDTVRVLLTVKKGKVTRIYEKGTPSEGKFMWDEDYEHFQLYEAEESCSSECERHPNPKFLKLMQQLKPYYGEKRWEIAKRSVGVHEEKALDEFDKTEKANKPSSD